jgi:hypothetical protein
MSLALLFGTDPFRKSFPSGLTVPLFVCLRFYFAFYQELREFTTLRFTLKRHLFEQSNMLALRAALYFPGARKLTLFFVA